MTYHNLTYKKELDQAELGFAYWIVLDGILTDYQFDEAALKASSLQDGIYPLVVCGCGVIGCSGMYVTTRINGDEIIWEKFWFRQCCGEPDADDELKNFCFRGGRSDNEMAVNPPMYFKLDQYRALAGEIERDIKSDVEKINSASQCYDENLKQYLAGDTSRL